MRRSLLLVLLCTLALRAPACALPVGKLAPVAKEMAQIALIHLGKDHIDVDLYLAFSGIPNGKIFTTILPLPSEPEAFSAEDIEGMDYYNQYVGAPRQRVMEQNALTGRECLLKMLSWLGFGSCGAGGPIGSTLIWQIPQIFNCFRREMLTVSTHGVPIH